MPGYKRIEVVNAIRNRGLIARLEPAGYEKTQAAVTALADGGACVVELVLQQPGGEKDFSALANHCKANDPAVLLGGGPADEAGAAIRLIEAGADFITGVFDAEAARLCNRNKVLYLPLANDEDAITAAEDAGAEQVRVDVDSPAGLARLAAGHLRSDFLPVKGIAAGGMEAWLQAGAACLYFEAGTGTDGLATQAADRLWEAAGARGLPLFSGLEHWGTYPRKGQDSQEIVDWYVNSFGFKHLEGEYFHFVSSAGPGRLEILKEHEPTRGHMAIKVRHMPAAVEALAARGIGFEPVKDLGRVKVVFLKQPDPAGNKVHLLYQAVA